MNRRQFLSSLLGAIVVTQLPPSPSLEANATAEWAKALYKALEPIFAKYFEDCMIFGSAAIAWTDEYPYARNVPYEELIAIPELYRSTGEYQ